MLIKKFIYILLALVYINTTNVWSNTCKKADPLIIQEVDEILPEFFSIIPEAMKISHVPGLALAIVHRDKIIAVKGFGVKNINNPEDKVDEHTVFQIASLSKPFTSTIIAYYVGLGSIDWNTKISDIDHSFELSNPDVTKNLTIGDLLSHQSGLPDHAGDILEDLGVSQQNILHRLRYIVKSGQFRKDYAYTNFGYSQAAFTLAISQGVSWEKLSQYFIELLGMSSTSFRYTDYIDSSNRADLHMIVKNQAVLNKKGRMPDAQSPAGGLSSSVHDFAKWLSLLTNRGCIYDEQFIDPKVLLNSQSNHQYVSNSSYGYGWNSKQDEQTGDLAGANHSGAFALGVRTFVRIDLQQELSIAIFTNSAIHGLPEFLGNIFFQILDNTQLDNWQENLSSFNKKFHDVLVIDNKIPSGRKRQPTQFKKYLGQYENQYFGTIKVVESTNCSMNDSGLCLNIVLKTDKKNNIFELIYFDNDIFYFDTIGENASGYTKVEFTINTDDQIYKLVIDAFNQFGNGTFDRIVSK